MTAEEVTSDAAVDTLRELCNQTIGSLRERKETRGLTLSIEAAAATESPALDGARGFEFSLPDDFTPRLLVAANVTTGTATASKVDAEPELAATPDLGTPAPRPTVIGAVSSTPPQRQPLRRQARAISTCCSTSSCRSPSGSDGLTCRF